jgi:hypothetical protein
VFVRDQAHAPARVSDVAREVGRADCPETPTPGERRELRRGVDRDLSRGDAPRRFSSIRFSAVSERATSREPMGADFRLVVEEVLLLVDLLVDLTTLRRERARRRARDERIK